MAEARKSRAKGGGDRAKKMTAAQQAVRDSAIVARRAAGTPWKAIAEEFGIGVRTAQEAAKHRAEVEPLTGKDPTAIMEELVEGFRRSIPDFEAMAAAYVEVHPSAAVGARKAANEARRDLALLLQSLGKLPRELGQMRVLIELREFVVRLSGALTDLDDAAAKAIEGNGRERKKLKTAVARVRQVIEEVEAG